MGPGAHAYPRNHPGCHDLVVWHRHPAALVHGVETATGIVLEQSTEELHATPMYRAVFGTETAQSEVE